MNIEVTSKPQAIDQIDRKILQLQMERMSVARDEKKEDRSSARVASLDSQISILQKNAQQMHESWEAEKAGVMRLQDLKNQIDSATTDMEKKERSFDLLSAAKLKYETIPELRKALTEEELNYAKSDRQLLRDTVTENDIEKIVSLWTGIPISKLAEAESKKLLALRDELDRRVIGQGNATKVVAEAIQRSRAGMADPNKPIASLAFLGPTGMQY